VLLSFALSHPSEVAVEAGRGAVTDRGSIAAFGLGCRGGVGAAKASPPSSGCDPDLALENPVEGGFGLVAHGRAGRGDADGAGLEHPGGQLHPPAGEVSHRRYVHVGGEALGERRP
jgi:hypothetical protein